MNSTLLELIEDTVRMLKRKGLAEDVVLCRIEVAVMNVLQDGLTDRVQSLASFTKDVAASMTAVAAEPAPTTTVASEPVPAPAAVRAADGVRLPSAFFKGTGKFVQDANGDAAEIGSWRDPIGDTWAADLTKQTRVIHYVDPKDGIVKSLGSIPDEAKMSAVAAPVAVITESGTHQVDMPTMPIGGEAQEGSFEGIVSPHSV